MASWVLGAFRDRSIITMTTLFKSLVRSKLEYCSPLWNPAKITDIQTIENVQKQFTRRIHGLKDLDYCKRLQKLMILSMQRTRERNSIIHVWKMLNGKTPNIIGRAFYSNLRLGIRASIPKFNHKAPYSIFTVYCLLFTVYDDSLGIKAAC